MKTPQTCTVPEAAAMLNCSYSKAYAFILEHELKATKVNNKILVNVSSVDRLKTRLMKIAAKTGEVSFINKPLHKDIKYREIKSAAKELNIKLTDMRKELKSANVEIRKTEQGEFVRNTELKNLFRILK